VAKASFSPPGDQASVFSVSSVSTAPTPSATICPERPSSEAIDTVSSVR